MKGKNTMETLSIERGKVNDKVGEYTDISNILNTQQMAEVRLNDTANVSTEAFLSLFGGEKQYFICLHEKNLGPPVVIGLEHFSKVADRLTSLNNDGYGVFFVVNETDGIGNKDVNITAVRAVYLDLDDAPLQPVLETGLAPHCIVKTSDIKDKCHLYWLVSDLSVEEFKTFLQSLIERFGGDASVCNPARLMRVPGFYHNKGNPFISKVIHFTPDLPAYKSEDIIKGLGLELNDVSQAGTSRKGTDKKHVEHERLIKLGRNTFLSDKAFYLKKTQLEGEALIDAVNSLNQTWCEPPLTTSEVRRICKGKTRIEPDTPYGHKLLKFDKINICLEETGWEFFLDQQGDAYVNAKVKEHQENIKVSSQKFRHLIRNIMREKFNIGISRDLIDQAVEPYIGKLYESPVIRTLSYRHCWNDAKDKILIDSGRSDWGVFEIGIDGWKLTYPEFNPFIREPSFRPYDCTPDTERASWNDLFKIFQLDDEEHGQVQGIIKIWLATALIPDIARPALVVNGAPDSGKSTLAAFLKKIVDPALKPLKRFPKDLRSLELALYQSAIPSFDNLTYIDNEQSDILCQCITGSSFPHRKLYTDNESVEFELKNPFILTGVTVPGNLSDFLSRIFLLELDEIPEENRQTEQAMNKELDKLLPRIQALVFDCLQEGLARLQYIRTDNLYRLADCHRYSLAMKEILELKGVRLDAVWNKNKSTQNSEASDGDILTEILPKFLNLMDTKHWNGTISDLHEALFNRFSPDQQPWKVKWPKTAMGLSKRLTMLTSALNSVGVTFVRERGSGKRILSLKLDTVE